MKDVFPEGSSMKKAYKILLGLVVVAGLLVVSVWVHGAINGAEKTSVDNEATDKSVPVVLSQIREMVFEEQIQISGNIEAKNTALVSARIPGSVDAIYVDEGDSVEKGKTKLFVTDSLKLTKAVDIASKNLYVAQCSLRKAQANQDQIQTQHELEQADMKRYEDLAKRDVASKHELETQQSKFLQSLASLKFAKASVDLAEAQAQLAESNLAMAKKDLSDAMVIAPISGRVTERLLEPGEMASAGTPVIRIDDLSVIEITAYLPETYYARVVEGSTIVRANVHGIDVGSAVVTTKNPKIHSKLRTFEIKALLSNPPAGVVPGCRAELVIILDKRKGLGVPRVSIVRRGKGVALFTTQDGKAKMIPVEAGLEMDGWVEVKAAGLAKNAPVVRMGQDLLNDGMSIFEVKEDAE